MFIKTFKIIPKSWFVQLNNNTGIILFVLHKLKKNVVNKKNKKKLLKALRKKIEN